MYTFCACLLLGLVICDGAKPESCQEGGAEDTSGDRLLQTKYEDTTSEDRHVYIGPNNYQEHETVCTEERNGWFCEHDSGNPEKRVNDRDPSRWDYPTTHYRVYRSTGICAKRTDAGGPGWGMQLKISCRARKHGNWELLAKGIAISACIDMSQMTCVLFFYVVPAFYAESNTSNKCNNGGTGCAEGPNETTAYYNTGEPHFDIIWGKDQHTGYYPHLVDHRAVPQNFQQASMTMTREFIKHGAFSHKSRLLDLGCGRGNMCKVIAELTGAECTGLDLDAGSIARAQTMADENPELRLNFQVGSYAEIPTIFHGRFTHVVSMGAFYHAHDKLPAIMQQVKLALEAPSGIAVISDIVGSDDPISPETRGALFNNPDSNEVLLGRFEWLGTATEAGLVLQSYDNQDKHALLAYSQLAEVSLAIASKSLHERYTNISNAFRRKKLGRIFNVFKSF